MVVQPSHVGKTLGVFLAVETKKPGGHLTPGDKRGQAQAAFLQSVGASAVSVGSVAPPTIFPDWCLTRAVIAGN